LREKRAQITVGHPAVIAVITRSNKTLRKQKKAIKTPGHFARGLHGEGGMARTCSAAATSVEYTPSSFTTSACLHRTPRHVCE